MQRLLPETAMKELHSQAPGGNEVQTMRRHHLAFGCFGGVAKIDSMLFELVFIQLHIRCVSVSLLDVLGIFDDSQHTLMHTPSISCNGLLLILCLDLSSRLLFDSFEPSLYPSSVPP